MPTPTRHQRAMPALAAAAVITLTLCWGQATVAAAAAGPEPWERYIYAPASRTVLPARVHSASSGCDDLSGTVQEWGGNPGGPPIPQLNLTCAPGSGSITAVDFASWGTPSGSCGAFQKSSCDAASSVAVVEKLCVGRTSCVIPADLTIRDTHSPLEQLFGDPCPGVQKHLAVQLSGCRPVAAAAAAAGSDDSTPIFPVTLKGKGANVVLDFGREVGGQTTLHFGATSDGAQTVGMAWSESTYYIATSDHSNGGHGPDGTLTTGPVPADGTFTPSASHLRGGFRYLNLFLETSGSVTITNATLHFSAAPTMTDLRAYKNHFMSSDETVNKVWYGAAYTTQMCAIDPAQGRQWPPPASGWNNSASAGVGATVLVDGAKRDRMIWPGDMGVSVATLFATVGLTAPSVNALTTLYKYQAPDGMLPYVGPPIAANAPPGQGNGNSDTYHMWALIGTASVFSYTGDRAWLSAHWEGYQRGVNCSLGKVGPSGLMVVDRKADWARGGQGGENIAANALLYRNLVLAGQIAGEVGAGALSSYYAAHAAALKTAINNVLWDEVKGAFKDNPTSSVHPQDGNSLAAWFNATTADRATKISDYLVTNWGEFGSSSPEWNNDIGTFPGSMEVWAHMTAGQTTRALDLIRLQWGYMLAKNESTQSTFWEGYHKDGSFAYQGIYMSNSHGWASGPGGALTYHVAGVRPAAPGGREWLVAPQPGDLATADGSLTFGDSRKVRSTWASHGWAEADASAGADASFHLTVDSRSNVGSTGRVGLPLGGRPAASVTVEVNGVRFWRRGSLVGTAPSLAAGELRAEIEGDHLMFSPWRPALVNFTVVV